MRGSPRAPSAAALDAGRALAMGPTKRLTGREAADVRKGSSRVGKVTPVPGNPSVPGYEVVAMLGEGSQGRVFKLRHATTGRIYAGKRLWEPTVKATRRFEREIEALQRLDHANIVSLVEVVRDGNNPVLVMEFVEGPSLTTIVQRQKKLDAVRGLNLARQIADGLAYASAAGVVHRDVKPSNVLVGPGDTAKLTDFGLVWFEDVRTRLTADGQWIGTPNYMAPEQVNAGPTDGRTDVWGLAATFYQVLTGALPFSAGNPLELFRHIREDEPDFERLEQAAGKPAAAVFRRFFAKELTDRPAPAEASAALSQLLLDRLA